MVDSIEEVRKEYIKESLLESKDNNVEHQLELIKEELNALEVMVLSREEK